MSAVKDFLKDVEDTCKKRHKDWSASKDLSEKAWDRFKKANKGTQLLKDKEVEYKKLKFDKDLGPDLDKLHKKDKKDEFLALAGKLIDTVDLYRTRLKSADLPEDITDPLKASLKKLKNTLPDLRDGAAAPFQQELDDADDKAVKKGKLVPGFDLVNIDFSDEVRAHDGWQWFDGDTPDMTLSWKVTAEVIRKEMAHHGVQPRLIQDHFIDEAVDLFSKQTGNINSLLNELHSSHSSQMPPALAKSEIEDVMKEIRKAFFDDLPNRLMKQIAKEAGVNMRDLLRGI